MKWTETNLSKVLEDYQNGTWGLPPKEDGYDLPVLRSTNIQNATLVLDDVAFRSVPQKSAKRYKLLDGDILVTTSSGSRDLIGKNALFHQPGDGQSYLFSNFTLRLRPRRDVINPRYLHLYLNSTKAKAELLRLQNTTSGLRNLPIPLYLSQTVPLPPLSEQRRIVEILDQADALRKKRVEADAKATRILPALFYKMFGDPVINSRNFPTRKLGDLIEEPVFGLSKALSGKTVQEKGTIPILRMANITPEGFLDFGDLRYEVIPKKSLNRYTVKRGDLLFNWRNSPKWIGKTAIFHSNGLFSYASFLYRLRVKQDQADNRYIWQLLNALVSYGWFTQKCRQAVSQANFGREELANIDIPYPQLGRQQQFGKAYDQWVLQKDLKEKSSRSLDLLFQTLLHRAFIGDLTSKWREAHMKELLVEMEEQAKALETTNHTKNTKEKNQ